MAIVPNFSANKEYKIETFYGVKQLKDVTLNMIKSLLNVSFFSFCIQIIFNHVKHPKCTKNNPIFRYSA